MAPESHIRFEPVKIHYVGPYPPTRGGIAQHASWVLSELRSMGHDVQISAWDNQYPSWMYPGDEQTSEGSEGSEGREGDHDGAERGLRWWSPRSWLQVGRRARDADVLIIPWVTPLQAPAYGMVAKVAGVPLVALVHNPLPHERHLLDVPLSRWFLSLARGAVVHGAGMAAETRELVPGLAVRSVPHPPNMDLQSTPLPPGPPYRLLCLGYVRPYKGPDIAIESLGELVRRGVDVSLTIAGEAWMPANELQALAARLGVSDRVDLRLSYQNEAAVERLLDEHHVLLASYRSATGSGVVPLAHAAGRPVVATPVGGLPDAVQPGRGGILAASVAPVDVATAVIECLAGLEALAASARSVVGSWQEVASAVVELRVKGGG